MDTFKHYFLVNFGVLLSGRERFGDILFLMDAHEDYKRKQKEAQQNRIPGEHVAGRRVM